MCLCRILISLVFLAVFIPSEAAEDEPLSHLEPPPPPTSRKFEFCDDGTCFYQCHCRGGGNCTRSDGSCPLSGDCADGWSDSGCQRGNVALNKRAKHSSWMGNPDMGYMGPHFAVDGKFSRDTTDCQATAQEPHPWWYVDLGANYALFSVQVLQPTGKSVRNGSLQIHVVDNISKNMSNFLDGLLRSSTKLCRNVTSDGGSGECSEALTGRYILVHQPTLTQNSSLFLCEVSVMGYRFRECAHNDTFGVNCRKTCHCRKPDDRCNQLTGACKSGCAAGWLGSDCQTSCESGKYGIGCGETCGHCEKGSCDNSNGMCFDGCKDGYKKPYCVEKISIGITSFKNERVNVGQNASFNCSIIFANKPDQTQKEFRPRLEGSGGFSVPFNNFKELNGDPDISGHHYSFFFTAPVARDSRFHCIAGEFNESLTPEVYELPRLHAAPNVDRVYPTQVVITWNEFNKDNDYGDGPITRYIIKYRKSNESNLKIAETKLAEKSFFHDPMKSVISELEPNQEYRFSISLVREGVGGTGDPSPEAIARTNCTAPSDPPEFQASGSILSENGTFGTIQIELENSNTWRPNCDKIVSLSVHLNSTVWLKSKTYEFDFDPLRTVLDVEVKPALGNSYFVSLSYTNNKNNSSPRSPWIPVSFALAAAPSMGTETTILIVLVIFFLILSVLVLLACLLMRRRRDKKAASRELNKPIKANADIPRIVAEAHLDFDTARMHRISEQQENSSDEYTSNSSLSGRPPQTPTYLPISIASGVLPNGSVYSGIYQIGTLNRTMQASGSTLYGPVAALPVNSASLSKVNGVARSYMTLNGTLGRLPHGGLTLYRLPSNNGSIAGSVLAGHRPPPPPQYYPDSLGIQIQPSSAQPGGVGSSNIYETVYQSNPKLPVGIPAYLKNLPRPQRGLATPQTSPNYRDISSSGVSSMTDHHTSPSSAPFSPQSSEGSAGQPPQHNQNIYNSWKIAARPRQSKPQLQQQLSGSGGDSTSGGEKPSDGVSDLTPDAGGERWL